MDPDLPPGLGGFLPGFLGDLLRLLKTDSPLQWDLAQQLAQSVAAEDGGAASPDPVARIRLEELARIAELHVADVTGMTTSAGALEITVVSRPEWARRRLDDSRKLLEAIAGALAPPRSGESAVVDRPVGDEEEARHLQGLFSQWASAVAPAMIGMQFGSLVGHLARHSLGEYDLPLPRDVRRDEIVIAAANARAFAEDWSLPPDDVALYSLVRDLVAHAVVSREHVAQRLRELIVEHAQGFRPDPSALQNRLGAASGEMPDLAELTQLLGDPSALGEVVDSPEHRRVANELASLSAAILGYVEWASDAVASRIVSSHGPIREAMRRSRVARSDEERAGDALIGIPLGQEAVDRGEAFVHGVLERGGDAELAAMFVKEASLPTPAEVDAPGLWLARVNLPSDDPGEAEPEPGADC